MDGTSRSSQNMSTETLDRGLDLLQNIADNGVVKLEMPDDEAAILPQIQAGQISFDTAVMN